MSVEKNDVNLQQSFPSKSMDLASFQKQPTPKPTPKPTIDRKGLNRKSEESTGLTHA